MNRDAHQKAGHYEALGETLAKFEFFQRGWNPYTRFLDVEKVDLILRRVTNDVVEHREVQVMFGRLAPVEAAWEKSLFDVTSWRLFKNDEFAAARPSLWIAYVMSEEDRYRGDIFILPAQTLGSLIARAPIAGDKRRVYISRTLDKPARWVLRRQNRFDQVSADSCIDVTQYYRAFSSLDSHPLEPGKPA
jgi:hypothetical protein